jgi:hypothetical protein
MHDLPVQVPVHTSQDQVNVSPYRSNKLSSELWDYWHSLQQNMLACSVSGASCQHVRL